MDVVAEEDPPAATRAEAPPNPEPAPPAFDRTLTTKPLGTQRGSMGTIPSEAQNPGLQAGQPDLLRSAQVPLPSNRVDVAGCCRNGRSIVASLSYPSCEL
jgi:hypothetical protein